MAVQSKNIPAPDLVRPARALISVSDKTGIAEFATALAGHGIELVSTGGTARSLAESSLAVRDVSELTGFPEIMNGRVKTLHPGVHGGLLAIRDDADHAAAMQAQQIEPIDLLVVNLYPFEEVAGSGAQYAQVVENIDIGGPAMIRAAAKNHAYVTVITNPSDYDAVLSALAEHDGQVPRALRKQLAAHAYARTAAYDSAIANWFSDRLELAAPPHFSIGGSHVETLRYGENPHQQSTLYRTADKRPGVVNATQLQGKQLSWNNINDTDAAFELACEFDPAQSAAIAIIKHANPCGVALGETLGEAWERALACDPVSAFGGIVAMNSELDASAAEKIASIFTEVIVAPSVSDEAAQILQAKKNLRLLVTGELADPAAPGLAVRTVAGGLLMQSRDNGRVDADSLKTVTNRVPNERELADLVFAFRVAKHVKSNAIVYARDGATVGVGAGQMSRVDSARIAAAKARDAAQASGDEPLTRGSVVASDAFFPFADGLLTAVEAGATAVIQPGGSMRDEEVIAAADEAGIAMVFTGTRHFRH